MVTLSPISFRPVLAPVLALGLLSACAPSFEQMRDDASISFESGNARPSAAEQAEGLEALYELRAQSEANGAVVLTLGEDVPDSVAVPEGLPVVVAAPPSALTENGELKRTFVVAFWQEGPHAILGAADLVPGRRGERLLGLEVQTIHEDGEFLRAAGLQEGDIITAVNGRSIVLPDHFMEVWDALPERTSIEVDIERGEESLQLVWPILDDTASASTHEP
jgi:hypothetical protein